jgi:hypothetical protein
MAETARRRDRTGEDEGEGILHSIVPLHERFGTVREGQRRKRKIRG